MMMQAAGCDRLICHRRQRFNENVLTCMYSFLLSEACCYFATPHGRLASQIFSRNKEVVCLMLALEIIDY
jgi:hypothetical protein